MELSTAAEPWNGLAELRPAVRDYLFRHCRDESEADDIVQDTLIRASRYRGSLLEVKRLRPWLLRIAMNVLRDHVRKERRLPRIDADPEIFDRLEGREDVPGEVREEVQVELDGALLEKPRVLVQLFDAKRRLRLRDRIVLDSHYEAGRSCGETAVLCAIPRDLVKVRLFRARKRLHRALRSDLRREAEARAEGAASLEAHDRGATCAAAEEGTEVGAHARRGGGG
jgi:RNA polymerase sigma-70 factor (ECF subfamily)